MPTKLPENYDVPETTQFQPVPSRQEYRGTSLGYTTKRSIGGPLMRTLEFPQQYIYAGVAAAMGRLPDEWSLGSPFARIAYPGRYPRIAEAAITGTEDILPNLSTALLLDPLNFVGAGAITKLGKATKLTRGLVMTEYAAKEFGKGARATERMMNWLGKSENATVLEQRMGKLLGGQGNLESFRPVIDAFPQYGKDMFTPSYRLSEEIRKGQRVGFGVGLTTGWGGVAQAGTRGYKGLQAVENVYQGAKHAMGVQKLAPKVLMAKPVKGGLEMVEQMDLQQITEELLRQVKAETNTLAMDMGKKDLSGMIKDMDEAGITSRTLGEAALLQKAGRGAEIEPTTLKYLTQWQKEMLEIGVSEKRVKDFILMDEKLYYPRELYTNAEGASMPNEFYEHLMDKVEPLAKKIGGQFYAGFKWRRVMGGKPFISVTNLAHKSRSEVAPKTIKGIQRYIQQGIDKAIIKKDLELANQLREMQKPITAIIADYSPEGKFMRELMPFQYNDEWRSTFGGYIKDFNASKRAAKFGLNADSPVEAFHFFEEDLGKMIVPRRVKQAGTLTSGSFLTGLLDNFGFRRGTEVWRQAMKMTRPDKVTSELQSSANIVNLRDYLAKVFGQDKMQIQNIFDKVDPVKNENTFAYLHRIREKLENPAFLKKWSEEGVTLSKAKKAKIFEELGEEGVEEALETLRKSAEKSGRTRTREIDEALAELKSLHIFDEGEQALIAEMKADGMEMQDIFEHMGIIESGAWGIGKQEKLKLLNDKLTALREKFVNPKYKGQQGKLRNEIDDALREILRIEDSSNIGDRITSSASLRKFMDEVPAWMGVERKKYSTVWMDEEAAKGVAQFLGAWENLPATTELLKFYDGVQSIWARFTLFGGRSSYIWNNLTGDRFRAMMHGVHPQYLSGAKASQLQLWQKRVLKGAPHLVGQAEETILEINKVTGYKYSVKELLELGKTHGIEGGLVRYYRGGMMNDIDGARWAASSNIKNIGDLAKNMAKGEVPGFIHASEFFEQNGRWSTFLHFLHEGLPPEDAAEMVRKIHYNYSEQSQKLRRLAPFHYWTWKNTPDMMRELFKQPGKFRAPQKVIQTAWDSDDPTEDAVPEYMQATGAYIGTDPKSGKDVYFDLNNVPSEAALEILGLSENGGLDEIVQVALKQGVGMTSPFIQLPIEIVMNRDLFTGRAIRGGGAGAFGEKGITEVFGRNIQGQGNVQNIVHGLGTVFTPFQLAQSVYQKVQKEKMHPKYSIPKYIFGAPIRDVDRDSTEWINLSKQKNKYLELVDHYEAIGNKAKVREYESKAKKLQDKLGVLGERLGAKRRKEKRRR